MSGKAQTVISLDPIDQSKKLGFVGKLLITRYYGGKPVIKSEPYGHYMFCGPQRQGKTASVLWYAEKLKSKYAKKKLTVRMPDLDENGAETGLGEVIKFKVPPKIKLWSNFGVGRGINKKELFKLIDEFDPYANEIRIILVDEVHTYFPKEGVDKETKQMINDLNVVFSQLAKRNTFILSTAQIYGRLDKALREQCLYMVDCSVNFQGRLVNAFIPEDKIIADDLGRWAGRPKHIFVHGLAKTKYDTKRLVRF